MGLHTHLTHSSKLTLSLSILALQFLTFAIYFHHASYTLIREILKLLQKYIQLQRHNFISSAICLVENILSVTPPDWDIFTKVNVLHQNPIYYSNICLFFCFFNSQVIIVEQCEWKWPIQLSFFSHWWGVLVGINGSFRSIFCCIKHESNVFSNTHFNVGCQWRTSQKTLGALIFAASVLIFWTVPLNTAGLRHAIMAAGMLGLQLVATPVIKVRNIYNEIKWGVSEILIFWGP